MTRPDPALRFLHGLEFFGIKAGLRNIRLLLDFLGHPERSYPTIHVAGTNGKGSTSSMIASILTASGYRTGLYTSPHLTDLTERIRVDGRAISREELIRHTNALRPAIRNLQATFFEAVTAIAFSHFAELGVDAAVIETGLGGRLDATNVVTPLVSVITNIGLDHTEHLGTTIGRIAFEKGGIIKPFVPCVTGAAHPDALRVLRGLAAKRRAPLLEADLLSGVHITERSLAGLRVRLRTPERSYHDLGIGLPGDHQARNAQLAILAVERLPGVSGFKEVTKGRIAEGLARVRKNAGLRARLELVRKSPRVIADVAHNPEGIIALLKALRVLGGGNFLTLFGVMRDKDYRSMIRSLAAVSRLAIGVRPGGARALDSRGVAENFQACGARAVDGGSVEEGMRRALREAAPGETVLVTGSHYVVGEALKILNSSP